MGTTKPTIYSEHEIALWMESEGLDYLVQSYMSADHVQDDYLRKQFKDAKKALDYIEKRLRPHLSEDQSYEDEDYCILDKS